MYTQRLTTPPTALTPKTRLGFRSASFGADRQRPTFAADMTTPDVFRWVKNNKSTEQKLASREAYNLPEEIRHAFVFLSLKQGFCRIHWAFKTKTENL